MTWFNQERLKTVLTFPVETMALLAENGDCKDKEWGDFAAKMYSEGHSFFTYMSDKLTHSVHAAVYVMRFKITASLIHSVLVVSQLDQRVY